MATKRLIVLCFVAAACADSDYIFRGIPQTVVNGLRCYWKYTCFVPGIHSLDAPCPVYVPQKFCEDVKIHIKADETNHVDQLGSIPDKINDKRETTESSRPKYTTTKLPKDVTTKSSKDVTTKLPPPVIDPFVVIDAPVNCGPDELPDHNGKCRLAFGRGSLPKS